MPNGDPSFDEKKLPFLEAFFDRIALPLNTFAQRHNLRIEKYTHQSPSWDFTFKHPKGGVGKIEVLKKTDTSIKVNAYWWIDNYEKATRSIKNLNPIEMSIGDPDLINILDQILQYVVQWDIGSWDKVVSGYESIWHSMDRETFNDLSSYPDPT